MALLDERLHIGSHTHLSLSHSTLIVATRTDRASVGLLAQSGLCIIDHLTICWHGDIGMEHQTNLLLQRHLAHQVVDTILHGQSPVFIRIQLTILVQVLELVAVFLDNLHFTCLQCGLLILRSFLTAGQHGPHQCQTSKNDTNLFHCFIGFNRM